MMMIILRCRARLDANMHDGRDDIPPAAAYAPPRRLTPIFNTDGTPTFQRATPLEESRR